jgi:SAM-dependent methyltransferase
MEQTVYAIEHREQARNWWFRGRRRILDDLLSGLDLPAGARLLDFGCGTGANGPVLRRHGFAVGVDFSPHALYSPDGVPGGGHSHQALVRANVLALPVSDGSLDGAVALDVLEHLDDDRDGARELHRVLKPGAPLVVFVPAFRSLWGGQDVVSHHRRRYRKSEVELLLRDAGFVVERATFFNTLLFAPILAVRRAMRAAKVVLPSENQLTGPVANELLAAVFSLEVPMLRRFDLPFGVSIACVARRL